MVNPILTPEIRELLAAKDSTSMRGIFESMHPRMMADCLADLEPAERLETLRLLEPVQRGLLVAEMAPEEQDELFNRPASERADLAAALSAMPSDDRADLIGRLDESIREQVLPLLDLAAREDVRRLLAEEPGTVGSIMSTDFAALDPVMTATQAIESLRRQAPRKETIYYAYVTDTVGRLSGFVSLKDLVLADARETVTQLMHTDIATVRADDPVDKARAEIERLDLLAIPVVDADGRLVGIVTHDDAADVAMQTQSEAIERLGAVTPIRSDKTYLELSALRHFNSRVWWVVGLAAAGLVSGLVIHSFEDTLTAFLILALYMPMVADTGGNVGSQAATVVIRAMAVGEVRVRDWWRVVVKEATVAVLLAGLLGLMAFGKVMFLSGGAELSGGHTLTEFAWVIALALSMQVVTATIIGAVLPLAAKAARLDAAVVSTPALTTIVDITGLLIYFFTATKVLGLK